MNTFGLHMARWKVVRTRPFGLKCWRPRTHDRRPGHTTSPAYAHDYFPGAIDITQEKRRPIPSFASVTFRALCLPRTSTRALPWSLRPISCLSVAILAICNLISGMMVVPNMEESPSHEGSLPVFEVLERAPFSPRRRR